MDVDLIRRTVAKGLTPDELALFLHQCDRTGLDPLTRQIYAIKRGDKLTIQVSIDGLRVIADRTGELGGQEGPYWYGGEAGWLEWSEVHNPFAAKVTVIRNTPHGPARFTGVAHWDGYAGKTRQGQLNEVWAKLGPEMLCKCAEALALRKAFPADMSGLYTGDEMAQAADSEDKLNQPLQGSESFPEGVRGESPLPPPSRALETKLEVVDETQPASDGGKTDGMRTFVRSRLMQLDNDERQAVESQGEHAGLVSPSHDKFTEADGNSWLALIRGVRHATEQSRQGVAD